MILTEKFVGFFNGANDGAKKFVEITLSCEVLVLAFQDCSLGLPNLKEAIIINYIQPSLKGLHYLV